MGVESTSGSSRFNNRINASAVNLHSHTVLDRIIHNSGPEAISLVTRPVFISVTCLRRFILLWPYESKHGKGQ